MGSEARHPSYEDLALFNRALAEMMRGGVPLPEAVERAARELGSGTLRPLVAEIERGVRDGQTLAQALEAHRARLPELYVRMVEAGSVAGRLPETLGHFAAYAESRLAFERKVREATAYPKLVLACFVPLVLVMLFAAGPEVVRVSERGGVFGEAGPAVPPPLVRTLAWAVTASGAVGAWALAHPFGFLLAAAGVLVLARWGWNAVVRIPSLARRFHRVRRTLPVIGPIAHQASLGLILRAVATLVRSGVPLPAALALTASASDDPAARDSLGRLSSRAADGHRLSESLRAEVYFPPYVAWLLAKDEGGPGFADALEAAAEHYRERLENRVEAFRLLLLPTSEVILGLMVLLCYLTFVWPLIAGPRISTRILMGF